MTAPPDRIVLDVESLPDWWHCCVLAESDGEQTAHRFELSGANAEPTPRDRRRLVRLLNAEEVVTFNGTGFDLPHVAAYCRGASVDKLHALTREIVDDGKRHVEKFRRRPERHVDLQRMVGRHLSLKEAASRMDTGVVPVMPEAPGARIAADPAAQERMRAYCMQDCRTTLQLRRLCEPDVALRRHLNAAHGSDRHGGFLACTESQIGERMVLRGTGGRRRPADPPERFHYAPPAFLQVREPSVVELVRAWKSTPLLAPRASGRVRFDGKPPGRVALGGGSLIVDVGLGGLHSVHDGPVEAQAGRGMLLYELDAASYYPNIILERGVCPQPGFLGAYRKLVAERLDAKRAGRGHEAQALKLAVNGAFGKLGFPRSPLYDPEGFANVTLTGQLGLLMLAENMLSAGARVLSANTDGMIVSVAAARERQAERMSAEWQRRTGFRLERTDYRSFRQRDVNNYVAITADGAVKAAGAYGTARGRAGLNRRPCARVCADAVLAHLRDGSDPADYIRECADPAAFVLAAKSRTGIWQRGQPVGSVARWFVGAPGNGGDLETGDATGVRSSGRLLPDGANAILAESMPAAVPGSMDRAWYEERAGRLLLGLGMRSGERLLRQSSLFGPPAPSSSALDFLA